MKWKDYKYGSWLVVKFGEICCKLDVLGYSASGVENHFGIIPTGIPGLALAELLPGSVPGGGDYTRDSVKALVEAALATPPTEAATDAV